MKERDFSTKGKGNKVVENLGELLETLRVTGMLLSFKRSTCDRGAPETM
jgi:hypothetical protein